MVVCRFFLLARLLLFYPMPFAFFGVTFTVITFPCSRFCDDECIVGCSFDCFSICVPLDGCTGFLILVCIFVLIARCSLGPTCCSCDFYICCCWYGVYFFCWVACYCLARSFCILWYYFYGDYFSLLSFCDDECFGGCSFDYFSICVPLDCCTGFFVFVCIFILGSSL